MYESSLRYLRCVRCGGRLDLESLHSDGQTIEGFLACSRCPMRYPVISGVPVMWYDFDSYVACRPSLFGRLYLDASSSGIRRFIRSALSRARPTRDVSEYERMWSQIYKNSSRSRFYSIVSDILDGHGGTTLEHGCSVGLAHRGLSGVSFGIDRSFAAVRQARSCPGPEFVVADSLVHPFGRIRFDTVVALNMLEIVEPGPLLDTISKQTRRTLILSDPYDYGPDRPVRRPLDARQVRARLRRNGFRIARGYGRPGYLPWSLQINPRARLQYRTDIIVATK